MSLCWEPVWPACRRRAIWRAAEPTCWCSRPARAWAAGSRRRRCPTGAPCSWAARSSATAHRLPGARWASSGCRSSPATSPIPARSAGAWTRACSWATTPPWLTAEERADAERIDGLLAGLAAEIDPDDPWSHPDAARLDQLSLGAWLRLQGALPAVRRRYALASLSLSCDGPDRSSLLADLRKHATLAGHGFYDLAEWEGLRCSAGSAEVALRMAAELGSRVRLGRGGVAGGGAGPSRGGGRVG